MKYTFEPTIKNETKIKPTMKKAVVKESTTSEGKTFEDIAESLNISLATVVSMLDNYFSRDEMDEIEAYIRSECGDEVTEDIDMSPDNLLSKVNDNDLKNLVKSAGVKLSGSENKDQLVGMAKALASTNESLQIRLSKIAALESKKMKRKKGIPHKTEDEIKTESKAVSKFLK